MGNSVYDTTGNYIDILTNVAGCDSVVTLDLTLNPTTGIVNINNSQKTLLRITDILGRETKENRRKTLFYIYDDGTIEKKVIIE